MINNTKHCVLITMFSCIDQEKTHYTRVSRKKILQLLEEHHGIVIGYRWLSRCLKHNLDKGYLSRQTRYVHDAANLIRQLPSLFAFKLQGARYLFSNRVHGAAALIKRIIAYIKKPDNRWPAKEFSDLDTFRKLYPAEQARLKRLRDI